MDRAQQAERAERVDVRGLVGNVEAGGDLALGGEIVNLVGPDRLDQGGDPVGLAQGPVVQRELRVARPRRLGDPGEPPSWPVMPVISAVGDGIRYGPCLSLPQYIARMRHR